MKDHERNLTIIIEYLFNNVTLETVDIFFETNGVRLAL